MSLSNFEVRTVCPCGWSARPSFGDTWFTDNQYPCCPECGLHHSEREEQTGRMVALPKKRWWHVTRYRWEKLNESE